MGAKRALAVFKTVFGSKYLEQSRARKTVKDEEGRCAAGSTCTQQRRRRVGESLRRLHIMRIFKDKCGLQEVPGGREGCDLDRGFGAVLGLGGGYWGVKSTFWCRCTLQDAIREWRREFRQSIEDFRNLLTVFLIDRNARLNGEKSLNCGACEP